MQVKQAFKSQKSVVKNKGKQQNTKSELPASSRKFPLAVNSTCAPLSIGPTFSFRLCVHKSVLSICVSVAALQIDLSGPSFQIPLNQCLVTQSHLTLCNTMHCSPPGPFVHGDSPGKNTGVGCHFPLQGDIPYPGIKPSSLASPALTGILYHCATWEPQKRRNLPFILVFTKFS